MSTITIAPEDEMIAVLTDAIASKRATIEVMERAQHDATVDLQRLRGVRAIRLARAKGFEVGQVWLIDEHHSRGPRPAILFEIAHTHGGGEDADNDWRLSFAFGRDGYGNALDAKHIYHRDLYTIVGRIEAGAIIERLTKLMQSINENKAKAA